MEHSTDSFVLIAGLLLLAKVFGGISTRPGLPSVIGVFLTVAAPLLLKAAYAFGPGPRLAPEPAPIAVSEYAAGGQ